MKKTNSLSAYIKLGLLIVIAAATAGCQFGMEVEKDNPLASIDSFVEFYAPSYRSFDAVAQAERIAPSSSTLNSGGISATATLTPPSADDAWAFPTAIGGTKTRVQTNYPGPGLTTTGTVTLVESGTPAVYKVVAVTRPDAGLERIYQGAVTTETYFMASPEDNWTDSAYIIGDPTDAGSNPTYRETFTTEYSFADGSTATAHEHILAIYNGATPIKSPRGSVVLDAGHPIKDGFAPFDINGDMSYELDWGIAPSQVQPGTDVPFSSVVMFGYKVNPRTIVPFMPSSPNGAQVFGTRYYTEHTEGSLTVGTTFILEEVFNVENGVDPLARMVTRQRVEFNESGQATSRRQRMRITLNPGVRAYAVEADHNGLRNAAPRGQDAIIRSLLRRNWGEIFGSPDDFEATINDW